MQKNFTIGNTLIEVTFETDKEKIKKNLTKVYDVFNNLANKFEKRGIDTSSWFLNKEQIEKMKKDSKYTFL